MATDKRRFYNDKTNDTQGFTKQVFFATVLDIANGDDVDADLVELVARAAEYELEGMALKADAKAATGAKKDALDSDYANAVRAAIIPLLTSDPLSAKELVAKATSAGILSPTLDDDGNKKEFAPPWVSRVLNDAADSASPRFARVNKVAKIVDTIDSKGLKSQKQVVAYTA